MLDRDVVELRAGKNRSLVKEDILAVQDIVYPELSIKENRSPYLSSVFVGNEHTYESGGSKLRDLKTGDIKITTKTTGSMHMGSTKNDLIKLGVNWDKLQYKSIENYISALIHEIAHIGQHNHKDDFYKLFVSAVKPLMTDNSTERNRMESYFRETIDFELIPQRIFNSIVKQYEGKNIDNIIQYVEQELNYNFSLYQDIKNNGVNHTYEGEDELEIDDINLPPNYNKPNHKEIRNKFFKEMEDLNIQIWSSEEESVVLNQNNTVQKGKDWVYTCKVVYYSPSIKGDNTIPVTY